MSAPIEINDIQQWVEDQMIRGRYMFTKQDVLNLGLPIKEASVNRSLQRLEAKVEIHHHLIDEMLIVIRGAIKAILVDDDKNVIDEKIIRPADGVYASTGSA